jgi:ribosomal protein L11 methyltransferase
VSAQGGDGVDRAMRLTLPEASAEIAGAILMDMLGPFEMQGAGWTPPPGTPEAELPAGSSPSDLPPGFVTLVFYPDPGVEIDQTELLAALPEELQGQVTVQTGEVSRDWTEGWRDHFKPVIIGEVRIRPPWEAPAEPGGPLVDVVINPGLGFGTGLHPTTRGTLTLLQEPGSEGDGAYFLGPLVDSGTGSGILSIAAAKLGWGPIFAFDNDGVALTSARDNVVENGVAGVVEMYQTDIEGASIYWFSGATVLANMTLDPVLALLTKLSGLSRQSSCAGEGASARRPERLIVSGILAGEQERKVLGAARLAGFSPVRRLYEAEWVSMELLPIRPPASSDPVWG